MTFRHFAPIPYSRAVTATAEEAVAKRFTSAFAPIARQCAAALRQSKKVAKADAKDATTEDDDGAMRTALEIIAGLDLFDIGDLTSGLAVDLRPVVDDVARSSASIGLGDGQAFVNVVNPRAVAAVGSELAPAIKGISEATSIMLRDTIAAGLKSNQSLADIADTIHDAYALSPARAALIAATEVSRANSVAALASYKVAADNGVPVFKVWVATAGCCPTCNGNQAMGPIPLDQDFTGSPCPPQHPGCRCAISPAIQETTKMTRVDHGPESIMAPFHREAIALREAREGLVKVRDLLIETNAVMEKTYGGDRPTLIKLDKLDALIDAVDARMARPMPLPWDLALAAAPPAGEA